VPISVPWDLVPPNREIPSPAPNLLTAADALEDRRHRDVFLWTTTIVDRALAQPDFKRLSARPSPEFFWMAAGFVPIPPGMHVPNSVQAQDNFFFGLCLLPPPFPEQSPEFLLPLVVGVRKFPVLRLPAAFYRHHPHGGPPDPYGANTGTAACWAQPTAGGPNPTGLPGAGILTAAHVAIDAVPVAPMIPSSPYAVVGYAIDAAVLCPATLPNGTAVLNVSPAVAVGSNVDVYLRAGGSQSATILLTFQPSVYSGFLCPHRMIVDTSFNPGDSGALAKDQATQEAVGLYTGEIVPTGGPPRGTCQIMQQVVTELAIDLYL
jgi:hypothetical protein